MNTSFVFKHDKGQKISEFYKILYSAHEKCRIINEFHKVYGIHLIKPPC